MRLVGAVLLVATIVRPSAAFAQDDGPQAPDDSGVEVVKSVPFGGTPAAPLLLNVYQPRVKQNGRPAVVLVHGGSWQQGGPDEMELPGKLLAQQGWVGFSISYRLAAPGQPSVFPGNLEDVQAGVRWVGEHARDYGADPSRIALMGNSAGGHLAALVGTDGVGVSAPPTTGAPGGSAPATPTTSKATTTTGAAPSGTGVRVRAVVTFSAPTTLDQLVPMNNEPPPTCGGNKWCRAFWGLPIVPGMLGCQPAACPDRYRAASPSQLVTKSTPPMYLANSREEIVPMNQLEEMLSALKANGIDAQVSRIDGERHGSDPGSGYVPKMWNDMMPFVADALGVPTPQPIAFADDREFKDYLIFAVIGLLAVGLLIVFIWAAVREDWDAPGN